MISELNPVATYTVLGPDEREWFFWFDVTDESWNASSRSPGDALYQQEGRITEAIAVAFIEKATDKLTVDDKLDLFLFLYRGGIERFLKPKRKRKVKAIEENQILL